MATLASQLSALRSAPRANTLTSSQFAEGIWKLGTDSGNEVNWTSQLLVDGGAAARDEDLSLAILDVLKLDQDSDELGNEQEESHTPKSRSNIVLSQLMPTKKLKKKSLNLQFLLPESETLLHQPRRQRSTSMKCQASA